MKCSITVLFFSLAFAPSLDAAAQVLHRRPFDGNHAVTAYLDADGVDGNGSDEDYTCAAFAYDGHGGTDFGMPQGTTIVASAPGVVTRTNDGCPNTGGLGSTCGGYLGNWVEIEHPDGSFTMYAHMQLGSHAVQPGDQVMCGTPIGKSASSGNSSGPHLHYGSRAGAASNWGLASTRDPYEGPCGRQTSLWTNQPAYKAAPGTECQNTEVDVDIWIETNGVEDRLQQGSSLDKEDVLPEQTFEASISVRNASNAPIRGVELGYIIEEPFLEATNYVIESDVSGSFEINDADGEASNPAKDAMGSEGALTMYAFAAGETKRVRITVVGARPSIGEPDQDHPDVRGWVRKIDDVYAQAGFFDEPSLNETDQRQVTFAEFDILTTHYWNFDADEAEMLEGWTPCDDTVTARIDPARGGLEVSSAVAPCIVSPEWTSIDASTAGKLVIAAEGSFENYRGTLLWRRADDADFSVDRSAGFLVRDGAVELAGHPMWNSTIAQVRLQFAEHDTADSVVFIDSLRFDSADPNDPNDPDDPVDPNDPADPADPDNRDDPTNPDDPSADMLHVEARSGGCSTTSLDTSFLAILLFVAGLIRRR